jgi:hypothetical protein
LIAAPVTTGVIAARWSIIKSGGPVGKTRGPAGKFQQRKTIHFTFGNITPIKSRRNKDAKIELISRKRKSNIANRVEFVSAVSTTPLYYLSTSIIPTSFGCQKMASFHTPVRFRKKLPPCVANDVAISPKQILLI